MSPYHTGISISNLFTVFRICLWVCGIPSLRQAVTVANVRRTCAGSLTDYGVSSCGWILISVGVLVSGVPALFVCSTVLFVLLLRVLWPLTTPVLEPVFVVVSVEVLFVVVSVFVFPEDCTLSNRMAWVSAFFASVFARSGKQCRHDFT